RGSQYRLRHLPAAGARERHLYDPGTPTRSIVHVRSNPPSLVARHRRRGDRAGSLVAGVGRLHPRADQAARNAARRRHAGAAVVLEGPEVGRLVERRRRFARQADGGRPRRQVRAGRGVVGHGDRRAARQQDRHDVDDGCDARARPGRRLPEDAAPVLLARRAGARRPAGEGVGRPRQSVGADRRSAGEQHGQVPQRERRQGADLALPGQRCRDRRLPGRPRRRRLPVPSAAACGAAKARQRQDRRADAGADAGFERRRAEGKRQVVRRLGRQGDRQVLCERPDAEVVRGVPRRLRPRPESVAAGDEGDARQVVAMHVWNFAPVWANADLLALGLLNTLKVTGAALAFGIPLGLVLALMRLSPSRLLAWPAVAVIEVFRTTPPLVQLFWFFFALPILLKVEMTPYVAAVLTFSIQSAAFFAEVFRGGIVSVERGQWEAARALGMAPRQVMRRVVLPQAVKRMIPAFLERAIELMKTTTLV